jgi:adenine-specific DNA glycosylase
MQTIKAVVGVLRNKHQEILIAQRRKSQFMGGFWELPGGKIEHKESPEQAITGQFDGVGKRGFTGIRSRWHLSSTTPQGTGLCLDASKHYH